MSESWLVTWSGVACSRYSIVDVVKWIQNVLLLTAAS